MRNTFEIDPYPGKTRILFVGHPLSTHVHSWIDLLAHSPINVRFFAIPSDPPPVDWPVRTYLTKAKPPEGLDLNIRKTLYPTPEQIREGTTAYLAYGLPRPEKWLERIIAFWRPHIIHLFGLDPVSFLFLDIMSLGPIEYGYKLVVQTRGGSDLTLTRTDPEVSPHIRKVLEECDQIITDNRKNFEYLQDLGAPAGKIAEIAPVPGTGGIDIEAFADARKTPPSKRERIIVWPKAYECPWSKALPVLEAIKEAWEKIRPCEIYMLASLPEVRQWFHTLPEEIKTSCHIDTRIPRGGVLELMKRARVMLAPSLVDGIPNSMYEAMACGAFPIVSPLETIMPVVKNEENVLFARNLYPDEIKEALVRAMNDDTLVDHAARRNVDILRAHADRTAIAQRVVAYYEGLRGRIEADRKKSAKADLPPVSIITPAYNQASFLDETIQSVLSQDYPNLEYIILDDGSKDNTLEVLVRYGSRIRLESHENMGEALTVNKGFQLAKGDIICVVNADDPLLPGAVKEAVSFLAERPEILVAYPDWYYISDRSGFLHLEKVAEYDYVFMVSRHRCIVGPGAFMRKQAIDLTGGRDPQFKFVGDFDFWLRLGLHGSFARIPKALATFRIHTSSTSLAMKGSRMAREDIRLIKKFFSLSDLPREVRRVRMKAFSAAHLHASRVSGKAFFARATHYLQYVLYYPPDVFHDRNSVKTSAFACFKSARNSLSRIASRFLHRYMGRLRPKSQHHGIL
jgi:glycosyltransferase involved in cell wall biosynthesis